MGLIVKEELGEDNCGEGEVGTKVVRIAPRIRPPLSMDPEKKKNRDLWEEKERQEREKIKEFWLSLTDDQRRELVKLEKEAVLKKMKEQQKHTCSCSVCGRRRTVIEEELEMLYDAYYEELEHYEGQRVQQQQQQERVRKVEEVEPEEEGGFNFAKSLTVKGGILTVADDLLKNEGKKFLEMMEKLAERRLRRDEPDDYEEEDTDEEYDDEYEEDDEEEEEEMTEEQRLEEGRRMFQMFAAKMFEQRVLSAYREKVALENQNRLIAEEEEKEKMEVLKKEAKVRKAKMKKQKRRQIKQQAEEKKEQKRKEKEKEEQDKLEQVRRQQDEQRRKKEEEKKQKLEEEQRKEKERIERERKQKQKEEEKKKKEEEKKKKEEEKKKQEEKEKALLEQKDNKQDPNKKKKKKRNSKHKGDKPKQKQDSAPAPSAQPSPVPPSAPPSSTLPLSSSSSSIPKLQVATQPELPLKQSTEVKEQPQQQPFKTQQPSTAPPVSPVKVAVPVKQEQPRPKTTMPVAVSTPVPSSPAHFTSTPVPIVAPVPSQPKSAPIQLEKVKVSSEPSPSSSPVEDLDDDADIASLLQNLIPTSLDESPSQMLHEGDEALSSSPSPVLQVPQYTQPAVKQSMTPRFICTYCGEQKADLLVVPCNDQICMRCINQFAIQVVNFKPAKPTTCQRCATLIVEFKPVHYFRAQQSSQQPQSWSSQSFNPQMKNWNKNGYVHIPNGSHSPSAKKAAVWTQNVVPDASATVASNPYYQYPNPPFVNNTNWTNDVTTATLPQTLWTNQPFAQQQFPPSSSATSNPWQYPPPVSTDSSPSNPPTSTVFSSSQLRPFS